MTAGDLTVDNVVINNSTIGHVNNTNLMVLASNSLTVNSDLTTSGNYLPIPYVLVLLM